MRTEKEYKDLTVKEFTKAAEIYETDHASYRFGATRKIYV